MNKIKKVFVSLVGFIVASFSKLVGLVSKGVVTPLYGPPEVLYGPPEPNPYKSTIWERIGEKMAIIGKIAIPIVLVLIGIIVLLNKKIKKETKTLLILILFFLGILIWLVFYVINMAK